MTRLEDIPDAEREVILNLEIPTYDSTPFVPGPPVEQRRVAIVSTAGLQRRGDRAFGASSGDYRIIPGSTDGADLILSHASPNFDRTGFQADANVMFPLERLREMAEDSEIGSVAGFHYSFMGAAAVADLVEPATRLADLLLADDVDAVLLVPV